MPSLARGWRTPWVLSAATIGVAVLPIAVAAGRALGRDWLPLEDNALFELRTRDVLTDHNPLLGTWSSASLHAGVDVNHPGPLLFDALAVPVRLIGGGGGVALGSALLNAVAVTGIGVLAHRRGGPLLVATAMAVTAALCLAMGSEVLVEPWGPHVVLLPFLCFAVATWSVACGDLAVLPWAAVAGSLVAQTHLGYVIVVGALGVWAVAALVAALRRERRTEPACGRHDGDGWCGRRPRPGPSSPSRGRSPSPSRSPATGRATSRAWSSSAGDTAAADSIGFGDGVRVLAYVVGIPRWWLPSAFEDAWQPRPHDFQVEGADLPPLGAAAAALVALAAVVGVLRWAACRRGDVVAARALDAAALLVLMSLLTAGQAPVGPFTIAPHQFRWLWGVGAFVALAVAVTVVRLLPRRVAGTAAAALAGVTAALAAATLPDADRSVVTTPEAMAVARDVGREMGPLEEAGTLLIARGRFQISFADPYGFAVLAELRRRDVPFVADDPVLLRHVGEDRRFTGDNADAALYLRTGDAVRTAPPGTRPVVVREGLTEAEQEELLVLTARITSRLGQRRAPGLPEGSPAELVRTRAVVEAVEEGRLDADPPWGPRFARYAVLQHRWDTETVALFIAPVVVGR